MNSNTLSNTENINSKNVLLLGAADGIGLAISKILEKKNYNVYVTSRKTYSSSLKIKYFHTHQKIFSMLNSLEQKKIKEIFDFYELNTFQTSNNNIFKRLNIDLITHIYPDHYLLNEEDFKFNDNYMVLMTEKDFVKCEKFKLKNTYYLPTKIIVDNDIKIMLNDKLLDLLKV